MLFLYANKGKVVRHHTLIQCESANVEITSSNVINLQNKRDKLRESARVSIQKFLEIHCDYF